MKQENISSQWNHLSSQAYLWYLPLGSICTDHFVLTSLKPPPQVLMLDPSNSSNHCFLYRSFGDRDPPRSMQHGTSSSGEDIFGWKPCSNSPGSHPEKNYYGTRQLPFRIKKTYSISYRIPIVYQTINLYPHRMVLLHEGWTARL